MFESEASSWRDLLSFEKHWLQKDQMGHKGLFLSLRSFNVKTPPTKLTTQPPTSQVAKQICYCLSAQYESHASSWLHRKQQTKRNQVRLVRIFCFNLTTISVHNIFFVSFLDLSVLPVCAEIPLLLWAPCYFLRSVCVQACERACVPAATFRVICLC